MRPEKTNGTGLPEDIRNGLLAEYFPADYCDTFRQEVCGKPEMTPEELFREVFSRSSWWAGALMKIRNTLAKPFGLKTGKFEDHLQEMIRKRNDREIVLGMDDKHLAFYVSLRVFPEENDKQQVAVTTLVHYNNALGRMYFFAVRPFHRLILRSALSRAAGR